MDNPSKLHQRRWAMRLMLTAGLALLFPMALRWGLREVTRHGPTPPPVTWRSSELLNSF